MRSAGRALLPEARWTTVFWSIIPGLGHLRAGQTAPGFMFLGIWAGLLLAALAFVGSGFAWFLTMCALGFHCFVMSLLMSHDLSQLSMPRRVQAGLVVYLILLLCLYGPVVMMTRGLVRTVPLNRISNSDQVANGDVLLTTGPLLYPDDWERGDLVLYRVRARGGGGVLIEAGWGVDRIVGMPGDHVRLDDDGLRVNGAPVPREHMPVGNVRRLPEIDLTAGENEYIILPSALLWRTQGQGAYQLRDTMMIEVARVHATDMHGRAWWRMRPWRRFGSLKRG
jgi:hypothetical protein